MHLVQQLKKLVNQVPVSMKLDPRVLDMAQENPMTVNVLLDRIYDDLGPEAAKQFTDVVILNEVPENASKLIEYLMPMKGYPVAKKALETLTRAKPCTNCGPTDWKPSKQGN